MRAARPWRRHRRPGCRHQLTVLATCAMASMGKSAKADAQATAGKMSSACLTWNAETSCSSAQETKGAVEDVLGRPLFGGASCDLQVDAAVRRDGRARWQAELSFTRRDGSSLGVRTLQSPSSSCKTLKNPIALVVALMVEDAQAQSTLHVPEEEKPRVADQRIFTALVASRGLLPSADLGTTFGVDLLPGSWLPGRAETTLWLPESSAAQGPGGQFWAWHAGLAACPSRSTQAHLRGSLCLGTTAGMIHGRGLGLDHTGSATRAYADVQARAAAGFPVWGALVVTAYVGAAVPWLRPRFVYLDVAGAPVEVHRPSSLVALAGIGIELPIVSSAPAPAGKP